MTYIHFLLQGMCHKLAVEKGVSHAQLPISQYIDLKCRKVLTIDHGKLPECSLIDHGEQLGCCRGLSCIEADHATRCSYSSNHK